jgi:hypothetical protein
MDDIATPEDVTAAIDAIVGSSLTGAGVAERLLDRLSPNAAYKALEWSHGHRDGLDVGPAPAILNAIPTILKATVPFAGFKSQADFKQALEAKQRPTPEKLADAITTLADDFYGIPARDEVVAYCRRVALNEPAPRLGRALEIANAAAAADEDTNRINLRAYRENLDGFASWADDGDADSVGVTTDSFRSGVPMGQLAVHVCQTEYLIRGVLPVGQPTIAIGGPKDGKTLLTGVELGTSLTTGTKYLGSFEVPNVTNVLFLSGESGDAAIVDAYKRCCRAKGVDPEANDRFVLSTWLPQFGNAASMAELESRIRDAGAKVVIVDPAGLCMSAAAASMLSVAYAELRSLADVCRSCGATPVVIHHAVKNARRLSLRSAAGAGFAEWARSWLILDRIGSFKPANREHSLRLTAGGSAGHAGEWLVDFREGATTAVDAAWRIAVRPVGEPSQSRKAAKIEADAATIVEAMRQIGKPATGRELRAGGLKMNGTKFAGAMAHLVDSGTVSETVIVKGGQECMAYALAEASVLTAAA